MSVQVASQSSNQVRVKHRERKERHSGNHTVQWNSQVVSNEGGTPSSYGTANEKEAATKGTISQLQEYIQGSKQYPAPPNCPILQWSYEERINCKDKDSTLEFRATAAFLLDGVPHHSVGSWHGSKKNAQRDAAERTLGLFVSCWGDFYAEQVTRAACKSQPWLQDQEPPVMPGSPLELGINEVQILEHHYAKLGEGPLQPLRWSLKWLDGGLCQALVEADLLGVPHTFPGKACANREEAYADTARRVLWYLQCPGYEQMFEPDIGKIIQLATAIPKPATEWAKQAANSQQTEQDGTREQQMVIDRKTIVQRVQNRLQQAFAGQLENGQSVWYWKYERDHEDKTRPQQYRAMAHIPAGPDWWFIGDWARGQRDAQSSTCQKIEEYLDALDTSPRSPTKENRHCRG